MLRVVGHLLCLIICCRGADGLTETLVELGQNATINCSLNIESAYWYIQHQPQPPLAILRSFTSSSPAAFYYNNNYRQKYSLETGNRLFMQNVTVDDCGVFYCAKKEESRLIFSNGTRLMTADKPDIQLSKPDIQLSKPDIQLSKPDIQLSKPDIQLSKPDLQLQVIMGELSSVHLQCSECYSDGYDPGAYLDLAMSEQELSFNTSTKTPNRPEVLVTGLCDPVDWTPSLFAGQR
ncbi:uncharacterized protein ACWYII_032464 isoform 2-T2 [Salvelinus alpinus]